MRRKNFLVIGVGAFCCLCLLSTGVAVWIAIKTSRQLPPQSKSQTTVARTSSAAEKSGHAISSTKRFNKEPKPPVKPSTIAQQAALLEKSQFTPREKMVSERLQNALDGEDWARVSALAKDAAFAQNAALRAELIAALGWFGPTALQELTNLLFDENQELAGEAFDHWAAALDQLESPSTKAQILLAGMKGLVDSEKLELAVAYVDDLPEGLALRTLVEVISSSNAVAAEAARRHYEHFTGEPYMSRDQTEAWISEHAPAIGE